MMRMFDIGLLLSFWMVSCEAFGALWLPQSNNGWTSTRKAMKSSQQRILELHSSKSNINDDIMEDSSLEVVLFGVGDLRISDHAGLRAALSKKSSSKILPLVILSTEDTLHNLPGIRSSTVNMATMISSAINSLSEELKSKLDLDLEVHTGASVTQVLQSVLSRYNNDSTYSSTTTSTNVHVCDLGKADSQIGYNPLPYLLSEEKEDVHIQPWACHLRKEPWEHLESSDSSVDATTTNVKDFPETFPETFPEYADKYCANDVLPPLDDYLDNSAKTTTSAATATTDPIITPQTVLSLLETSLGCLDNTDRDTTTTTTTAPTAQEMEQTLNTGLFGTHWGGLHSSICTEVDAAQCLHTYAHNCQCDDDLFVQSDFYTKHKGGLYTHPSSLEHASLSWMASSTTSSNSDKQPQQQLSGKNLIKGELMTRYLAAPLFLGCVSKRQVYDAGKKATLKTNILQSLLFGKEKSTSLEENVEHAEWQTLFAEKNIRLQETETSSDEDIIPGTLNYRYYRWHGQLCRYAMSHLQPSSSKDNNNNNKSSLILVHGFGASSNQFTRAVKEFATQQQQQQQHSSPFGVTLVPDLIGFGQSSKPALSYTQYLWESYVTDFVKDISLHKHQCETFTVGGNSIGGYTSMGCAADDSVVNNNNLYTVTASGAPGTNRCDGLILMNSAGMIYNREDVEKKTSEGELQNSIAEKTIGNGIGLCSPPPRPIAAILGTLLLNYLRPRIESITKPLYPSNPDNVDTNLCANIRRDSLDPGAINVMISGSKLPPPRTANELLAADFGNAAAAKLNSGAFTKPVLVTQGMKDPLNDATGRAKMFGELREGVEIWPLDDGGHCPHDELPADVVRGILQWAERRDKSNDSGATYGESSGISSSAAAQTDSKVINVQ